MDEHFLGQVTQDEHFLGQVTQKAILKYGDSLVLVKEKGEDKWILPGGRLNVRESPEEGFLREIKEELRVDCAIEKIISVDAYHGGNKTPKFFVFYLASILPNQKIITNSEVSEMSLVSRKEELGNFVMPQNQKDVIEKFLDEDMSGTTIDFTEIKRGGVPIDEVIASLERLKA